MKIGILAFPADQQKKLQRILSLSKTRTYELVDVQQADNADLLIAFGEETLGETHRFGLPVSHVLVAGRSAPAGDHPHLKVPFISSRVLRIVDAIEPFTAQTVTQAETDVPADTTAVEAAVAEPAKTADQTATPDTTEHSTAEADTTPIVAEVTDADNKPAVESKSEAAATVQAMTVEPHDTPAAPAAVSEPADAVDAELDSEVAEERENPFSKYDAQIAEVQRQQAQKAAEACGMEYSVLVVDDSHPMQQVLANELSQLEHTIHLDFADDGESALEKVQANTYDFIFLDIMMPGIDGFETCTRMRAMPELKKTPIIMLSSKTSPLDEVKGIMAGSSTYLTKPIQPEEFQKVIKRVTRWVSEFQSKRDQVH